MSANMQELRMAVGFKQQAALQTALVAADCWSLNQNNRSVVQPNLITEDNSDDLGKGDEFATSLFKTYWDVNFPWEYFLSSENAAMVAAFGLGKASKAAAGTGFKYTCTPMVPLTDGIELPSTTIVHAIRQGASDVLDVAAIGMCCEDFMIRLEQGPGRANSTMRSNWVGCGKHAAPSTITVPTITAEHLLNAGSAGTITILGTNYISTKQFVTCEFGWKNNIRLDSGHYPGSGSQDDAQIRGRMRYGKRVGTLNWTAEFANGSTELTDQLALTEGTAVIEITGEEIADPNYHKLTATFHRIAIRSAVVGDTDGIVTVACEATAMKHTSNGVLTIEVTNAQDNILVAAT